RAQRGLVRGQRLRGLALREEQIAQELACGEHGARRDRMLLAAVLAVRGGPEERARLFGLALRLGEPAGAGEALDLDLLRPVGALLPRERVAQRFQPRQALARPGEVSPPRAADGASELREGLRAEEPVPGEVGRAALDEGGLLPVAALQGEAR